MAFKDTKAEGYSFTLQHFVEAWHSAPFAQYYINTLIIVTVILAVQLITITLAAYAFARMNFIGKSVIFLLYLVQIMIPVELLIFPNSGTIAQLGIYDTKWAIMLPYFTSAFGVFLLRQTFKGIPYELEEAAKMEGCNRLQTIWHVYVPLAKPTYVAFGLISICSQWSNFLWPLIITDSDSNRPLTVGLSMFAKASDSGAQWGLLERQRYLLHFLYCWHSLFFKSNLFPALCIRELNSGVTGMGMVVQFQPMQYFHIQ